MGQHNIRIDDDLWHAVMIRARAEGRTVTDVTVSGFADYLSAGNRPQEPPRAEVPQQPDRAPKPRSGMCVHRIPAGAFCKRCA
jgi:hypothetical protein